MIAIIDYGVGNLYSLASSLQSLGLSVQVTRDAQGLASADKIILPGVGAFGDAMQKLVDTGLVDTVLEQARRKPLLGICLGMQLLFERSFEFGEYRGLGLIPGDIISLAADLQAGSLNYKVPHIGWNSLRLAQPDCPLLRNTAEGDFFYYVHSFYAKASGGCVAATSEYGVDVAGVVQNGNVYGTQFHPEKSGAAGLAMLKAFAAL